MNMRVLLVFFCFIFPLLADEIRVTARTFKSKGNLTLVTGDVHVERGADVLDSDIVRIYTDRDRKPLSYEAVGNVNFTIITKDGRRLKGRSNKLIYDVKKNEYRLYDDAFVDEIGNSNMIRGDLIVLTGTGDYANVIGNDRKPAHVTFLLDDKDRKKKVDD